MHLSISSSLDAFVRPSVRLLGRALPAFQVCGYAGLASAIALTIGLVVARGLSPWVMAAITLAAMATFLTLAMLTKIVAGEESLIYYHHEIAVLLVTALLLRLLSQPVLVYLDITILGVGAFLVFGRVGCLMVGCCHGRPHSWGVRYRAEHAEAGFDVHLVGARLFPTQPIESLVALLIVVVGSAMVVRGGPAGSALAWYVVAYDIGRFALEFMRGDTDRNYLWGFSEAQWIAVVLTAVVASAELAGTLPAVAWHLGAAVALVLWMTGVATWRTRRSSHQLWHPKHIHEVAAALDLVGMLRSQYGLAPAAPSDIHVARTYLDIQISASRLADANNDTYHYALSSFGGELTERTARSLAELITRLKHPAASYECLRGHEGVFHVLVRPTM